MLNPQPLGRIAWRDPRLANGYLVLSLAAFLGLLLLSRVVINSDEYIYAGEARALLHGRLVPVEGDPFPTNSPAMDFEGPRYPPGWPLVLALGATFSFRAMFVVALIVHLMGGAAVARMIVRRGLPSILSAVWLFHPLFWSFSTTLMSDLPAVALMLIAMDAWENGAVKTSAWALGYSFLVRASAPITTVGFFISIVHDWRRKLRSMVILGLGTALGLVLLFAVNTVKHGHPLRSPYVDTSESLFGMHSLLENSWVYGLALLAIPPFPLLCLLLQPRACDRWAWVALPVLGTFIFYGYRDSSPRFLENVLGGQRLILAAHAALVIATTKVWSKLPLIRLTPVVLAAGIVAVVTHHFAVSHLDKRYGPAAEAVAACKPDRLAYNHYASRVALSTDARAFYLVGDMPPILEPDVAVISLRQLTNRYETPISFQVPAWLRAKAEYCRRFGDFYVFDFSGRCPRIGETCNFPGPPSISSQMQ